MNISSRLIKVCSFTLLSLLIIQTACFALEKDRKDFSVEMITKMNCVCSAVGKNDQDCFVYYENTRFKIGSTVEMEATGEDKIDTAMGIGLNTFFSAGAIIPIYFLLPKEVNLFGKSYQDNPVSITEAKVIEQIPASGQQVKVLFNGLDYRDVRTDQKGHFLLNDCEEGVYEFLSFSEAQGVTLSAETFVSH